MPTLDPTLRDQLATVIGKENADTGARIIAEAGAKAAIEALAVHLPEMHPHLKDDIAAVNLRKRLRARARQLGDARNADGRHEIGRLVEQAAYEHWHRMLFARFLAENDLLIHPELKVAVTLDECAELAAAEGAVDGWELAGRYASRMLPQIFRPDDPLLAVRFAVDDVKKLEALLDNLPAGLFRASDSLGWCYQFWQARKKKEVNASEVKIGADELPAVTQLFTEPYMVQFLLHNTLGAWWVGAGRTLPVEMPYLRFLDDGAPAAGVFEGWPRLARELKVLDPCCGSGHFLVAAFEILVAFRMAEEALTAREACDAVLRDNLFGLEIDARCVQIAAFALAMAAWTYPNAGGYRPLAPMNVACSGLAISAKKEEWERLGGDNTRLRVGMGQMWHLLNNSPLIGSLLDPSRDAPNPLYSAGFDELLPLWDRALRAEVTDSDPDQHEIAVAARGASSAGVILSSRFSFVVTNVPYLGRNLMSPALRKWCDDTFPEGNANIATSFLMRCGRLISQHGTVAAVAPQNWLHQSAYLDFRRWLLDHFEVDLVGPLGVNAFETITGHVVNVCLAVYSGGAAKADHAIAVVNAESGASANTKAALLARGAVGTVRQSDQRRNPDSRLTLADHHAGTLVGDFAFTTEGLSTGDGDRFQRGFWEVLDTRRWTLLQDSPGEDADSLGTSNVVLWEDGHGELARSEGARIRGHSAWRRPGILVGRIGTVRATTYAGGLFSKSCVVLTPRDADHAGALLAFLRSQELVRRLSQLNTKVSIPTKVFEHVPFEQARWQSKARAEGADRLPPLRSRAPDQWFFTGELRLSTAPLHVAVARLLGYHWPDQRSDALDAHADKDGIVCIPALRGERPAADRLTDLLAAAWGTDWHPQTLTDLLAAVGHSGTLEEWLRDTFFKQHCELFHHRPFIWHVWDGHREGFSALVNYHRLDHEGLKSLTYTYLGDWIRTQEIESKAGKSGASDKVTKARALQQRLAAILEGEDPLDIFVRWKPIEQQPIGWHPDFDDGVRLNIRPFLTVADVGSKGAGVLRWKPNIQYGKDRGKNPPGSPWGEDRNNDIHLTLSAKRSSRKGTHASQAAIADLDDKEDEPAPWRVSQIVLKDVGPARNVELKVAPRLTLITGDNGLGKSFLLDVLWWAIAGHWSSRMALPTIAENGLRSDADAQIMAVARRVSGTQTSSASMHARFDVPSLTWGKPRWSAAMKRGVPAEWNPDMLAIYFRVNGSAVVFDPRYKSSDPNRVRMLAPDGYWSPIDTRTLDTGNGNSLEDDWLAWQRGDTPEFALLKSLMIHLSDPNNVLIPGQAMKIGAPEEGETPSLAMRNGDIPVALASAGVRHVLRFAYVLVRAWIDHRELGVRAGLRHHGGMVIVADEPELNLHPEWQRLLLPAMFRAVRELSPNIEPQFIVATHSPLLMASIESHFNAETDLHLHLSRSDRALDVTAIPFSKRGTVSDWLLSESFNEVVPRSIESQTAIDAAMALMRGDLSEAKLNLGRLRSADDEDLSEDFLLLREAIHEVLVRELPGYDRFWPRWLVQPVRSTKGRRSHS